MNIEMSIELFFLITIVLLLSVVYLLWEQRKLNAAQAAQLAYIYQLLLEELHGNLMSRQLDDLHTSSLNLEDFMKEIIEELKKIRSMVPPQKSIDSLAH